MSEDSADVVEGVVAVALVGFSHQHHFAGLVEGGTEATRVGGGERARLSPLGGGLSDVGHLSDVVACGCDAVVCGPQSSCPAGDRGGGAVDGGGGFAASSAQALRSFAMLFFGLLDRLEPLVERGGGVKYVLGEAAATFGAGGELISDGVRGCSRFGRSRAGAHGDLLNTSDVVND